MLNPLCAILVVAKNNTPEKNDQSVKTRAEIDIGNTI